MSYLQNLLIIILITSILLIITQSGKENILSEKFNVISSLIGGNKVSEKELKNLDSKLNYKDGKQQLMAQLNKDLSISKNNESNMFRKFDIPPIRKLRKIKPLTDDNLYQTIDSDKEIKKETHKFSEFVEESPIRIASETNEEETPFGEEENPFNLKKYIEEESSINKHFTEEEESPFVSRINYSEEESPFGSRINYSEEESLIKSDDSEDEKSVSDGQEIKNDIEKDLLELGIKEKKKEKRKYRAKATKQIEQEEEFKRFLFGDKVNNSEEEEYKIVPFVEEEIQQRIQPEISEEENIFNQEEEIITENEEELDNDVFNIDKEIKMKIRKEEKILKKIPKTDIDIRYSESEDENTIDEEIFNLKRLDNKSKYVVAEEIKHDKIKTKAKKAQIKHDLNKNRFKISHEFQEEEKLPVSEEEYVPVEEEEAKYAFVEEVDSEHSADEHRIKQIEEEEMLLRQRFVEEDELAQKERERYLRKQEKIAKGKAVEDNKYSKLQKKTKKELDMKDRYFRLDNQLDKQKEKEEKRLKLEEQQYSKFEKVFDKEKIIKKHKKVKAIDEEKIMNKHKKEKAIDEEKIMKKHKKEKEVDEEKIMKKHKKEKTIEDEKMMKKHKKEKAIEQEKLEIEEEKLNFEEEELAFEEEQYFKIADEEEIQKEIKKEKERKIKLKNEKKIKEQKMIDEESDILVEEELDFEKARLLEEKKKMILEEEMRADLLIKEAKVLADKKKRKMEEKIAEEQRIMKEKAIRKAEKIADEKRQELEEKKRKAKISREKAIAEEEAIVYQERIEKERAEARAIAMAEKKKLELEKQKKEEVEMKKRIALKAKAKAIAKIKQIRSDKEIERQDKELQSYDINDSTHDTIVSKEKPSSSSYIDKKSLSDMKNRLKNQVKTGTFINPEYVTRIDGYQTKDNQLTDYYQTFKESEKTDDCPKSLRQKYDELIPDFKSKENPFKCMSRDQKASCPGKYGIFDESAPTYKNVTNIYSNDTCDDPYSKYN